MSCSPGSVSVHTSRGVGVGVLVGVGLGVGVGDGLGLGDGVGVGLGVGVGTSRTKPLRGVLSTSRPLFHMHKATIPARSSARITAIIDVFFMHSSCT